MANDVFARAGAGLTESGPGAVGTSAFLNVSGQFVFTNVMDAYEAEPAVFTQLIPEATASTLDGEKIPGLTEIGDEVAERDEHEPYKIAGFGEDWVFTPQIKDRGLIVPLTWEAIFNDKTGLVETRASDVGKWFKQHREKHAIDCVVDENRTSHRYNWRGTVIASYGDNSGSHTWDNLAASNGLLDWTDLDAAEQLFNGLTDPYTGEPIMIEPKHLVFCKELEPTANYILNATMLYRNIGGYPTSGNLASYEYQNPWRNKYQPVTSRLLAARMATDTSWFLGDISAYAKCMMAEKMNVISAPPNSHEEFHRRIVQQHRVNERFAYTVVQPRAVVKSTA